MALITSDRGQCSPNELSVLEHSKPTYTVQQSESWADTTLYNPWLGDKQGEKGPDFDDDGSALLALPLALLLLPAATAAARRRCSRAAAARLSPRVSRAIVVAGCWTLQLPAHVLRGADARCQSGHAAARRELERGPADLPGLAGPWG